MGFGGMVAGMRMRISIKMIMIRSLGLYLFGGPWSRVYFIMTAASFAPSGKC
jgi:hypothetical protein